MYKVTTIIAASYIPAFHVHKKEVSKYVVYFNMLLLSPVLSLTTQCMLKQKPSKYYDMGI